MLTRQDIERYAERKGLGIQSSDLSSVLTTINRNIEFLDLETIEELDFREVAPYGGPRDHGRRPTPEEDPYNAIIRFCNVNGSAQGPLAGMRIGVKDNIAVAGIPLTKGKMIRPPAIPTEDAIVVDRILRAGANITAKTNIELGKTDFGRTLNPVNTLFSAGASSSGSAAAVSSQIVDAALGTDAGGSIRHPASFCGIVGIKPTFGLVPCCGISSGTQRLTQIGPMTSTVTDNAAILEVIAGEDWRDPDTTSMAAPSVRYTQAKEHGIEGLRIGIVTESIEPTVCKPDVLNAFEMCQKAFVKLGGQLEPITVPLWKYSAAVWGLIYSFDRRSDPVSVVRNFGFGLVDTKLQADLAVQYWLNDGNSLEEYEYATSDILTEHLYRSYLGTPLGHAQNLRLKLMRQIDNALKRVDVLITPMHPTGPSRITSEDDVKEHMSDDTEKRESAEYSEFATASNLTGNPALTVPSGLDENGIPTGLQVIGRRFDEYSLYRVGFAIESVFQ